jgi:peptide/nickel transport system ATP-binding protein
LVLIADEPTTALDVTVQAQIVDLMRRLQAEFGTAIIMITHDLGLIAEIADDVLVMYAGRAMEHADRRTLYYRPHHPYTRGLLASLPIRGTAGQRLTPIPGLPPSMIRLPTGCPFHPRCAQAFARCLAEEPPRRPLAAGHESACWLPSESEGGAA